MSQDDGELDTFYVRDVVTSIINNSDEDSADDGETSSTHDHTLTSVDCWACSSPVDRMMTLPLIIPAERLWDLIRIQTNKRSVLSQTLYNCIELERVCSLMYWESWSNNLPTNDATAPAILLYTARRYRTGLFAIFHALTKTKCIKTPESTHVVLLACCEYGINDSFFASITSLLTKGLQMSSERAQNKIILIQTSFHVANELSSIHVS